MQSFDCFSCLDCKLFMDLTMILYKRKMPQSDMYWRIVDHKFWQTCWHTFKIIIINIRKPESSGSWGPTAALPNAPKVFTKTVTQKSELLGNEKKKAHVTYMRVFPTK